MKEKKERALSWFLAIFLFIPLCINKAILFFAQKTDPYYTEYDSYYDWKHGKIHYQEKGHGKPLLFIHGISVGSGSHEWEQNFDILAETYHVYSIDLLGFGYSAKPKMTYTAFLYANLLNDFIQDVIQKPCAVIASNEGADFVVLACHLKPEHYKKMILISPSGLFKRVATNEDTKHRRRLEFPIFGTSYYLFLASQFHLKELLGKTCFFAKEKWITKSVINKYYYAALFQGANAKYALASFQTNFMNLNTQTALQSLRLPLYIIWGEKDLTNPIKNMEQVEKIKPRAYYAIFENTRRLPHYENASEFNILAKDFLR